MKRLALAGCIALLVACGKDEAAGQATAPRDALATFVAGAATVPAETVFDGVFEAANQSTVSAQTSGRVVALPYDVGDYVEKGAVIVRFTDTEQKARSSAAEAALAEARARQSEAQLTFDRDKSVYDQHLVSKAQLDKAAADLKSAQARVDAMAAALAEAEAGFGHTVIRAPYAGIVVSRQVQLGETVTPGRPLMTGLSLEHLRAVVDIPQEHIGPLRQHKKARVILPDGRSVDAAELRIPPNADLATHTFRVLVTLPQGEYGVFPGTLLKVAFVSGEEQRLLVPAGAVVRRGELTGVYVVAPDHQLMLRYLRVGTPTGDGRVPVLAGLVAGETVASDPIAAGIARKKQAALAPATGG